MSNDKVLFEEQDNIAIIKLNRPEKRNALDPETVLLFNDYSEKAKDKKYKSVVIKKKRYYFYEITWIDPTGDSGHATHFDSYSLIPSTMITHAYLFDKNKKYIWAVMAQRSVFCTHEEKTRGHECKPRRGCMT